MSAREWWVHKKTRSGSYVPWDGPAFRKQDAEQIRQLRAEQHPSEEFIVVRMGA